MALKLVKGIRRETAPAKGQKPREEYLVACLSEEANDPKFTEWERNFIMSLTRQVRQGRKLTEKQKQFLEKVWEK